MPRKNDDHQELEETGAIVRKRKGKTAAKTKKLATTSSEAPKVPDLVEETKSPDAAPLKKRGRVKFFNDHKGYGFVIPEDGSREAFLHANALHAFGRSSVARGATIEYEEIDAGKGAAVFKILAIDVSTTTEDTLPWEEGQVSFFNAEKGFGFIHVTGRDLEAVVHTNTIHKNGVFNLLQEQLVWVQIFKRQKGLKVMAIRTR